MAFIQLSKSSDNPSEALLVNTEHILSVRLSPSSSSVGGHTHVLTVNILKADQVVAYFNGLAPAQAAYNSLSAYLMPEPQTFALY